MVPDSSSPRTTVVPPDEQRPAPPASIVVPTRARPDYLRVALASIAPQSRQVGAELIVVDDAGSSAEARQLAERFGAHYEPHPRPLGLNVARNTGVERSRGELVVFVDDDVEVREGWLDALLAAAHGHPHADVFAGRILARLEGTPPRTCGRERPPITTLDLGAHDTATRFAWGSNMAIRRSALRRVGPFDVSLRDGGDEQEWQERLLHARISTTVEESSVKRASDAARPTAPATVDDSAPDDSAPATVDDSAPDDSAPVVYVADAVLDHRRGPADARLRALCRAAYARGRASRRFDGWRGEAPLPARELRTLAGCIGHVVRWRCPAGLTMVAHSAGRLQEAFRTAALRTATPRTASISHARGGAQRIATHAAPTNATYTDSRDTQQPPFTNTPFTNTPFTNTPLTNTPLTNTPLTKQSLNTQHKAHTFRTTHTQTPDDFLSGESGTVGGVDALRRRALDVGAETFQVVSGRRARLDRAARLQPPSRRVLALCVARPERIHLVEGIRGELAHSRHTVDFYSRAPGSLGKFENLNLLLASHRADEHDWLLCLDDDIVLSRRFLDRFLFLAERFALDLVQPAHRAASHAAWRVTRRHAATLIRETHFVEIGPVTAFRRSTFSKLLPFPELRMGWGLDMHWGALAREAGWRCGVVDATPISHLAAPAGSGYSREQALAEARAFLAGRPHLSAREAQQNLATHRRW